jgi:hypothetical protein
MRRQLRAVLGSVVLLVAGLSLATSDAPRSEEENARSALWSALLEACPPEYREIQIYAENPELTLVCFRSGNQTFIYSDKTGKVERVVHAKRLPPDINRITYRKGKPFNAFLLWRYGQLELSIGASG